MSGRGRPPLCPAAVIERIVLMRRDGARLVDICAALNAAGIPTPGGGATWWPSHVHRLLQTRHAHLIVQAMSADRQDG